MVYFAQMYIKFLTICPNMANVYQLKGLPGLFKGDYAENFKFIDKAVELNLVRYTLHRGFLKCIFTKDYEGAIADFEKAEQISPQKYEMDHTFSFYLGLCYLGLRNYEKSKKIFR